MEMNYKFRTVIHESLFPASVCVRSQCNVRQRSLRGIGQRKTGESRLSGGAGRPVHSHPCWCVLFLPPLSRCHFCLWIILLSCAVDVDTQNPEQNEGLCQWPQWVVVNIPENHINQGQVLSEYIGSGPLPGTGKYAQSID